MPLSNLKSTKIKIFKIIKLMLKQTFRLNLYVIVKILKTMRNGGIFEMLCILKPIIYFHLLKFCALNSDIEEHYTGGIINFIVNLYL